MKSSCFIIIFNRLRRSDPLSALKLRQFDLGPQFDLGNQIFKFFILGPAIPAPQRLRQAGESFEGNLPGKQAEAKFLQPVEQGRGM